MAQHETQADEIPPASGEGRGAVTEPIYLITSGVRTTGYCFRFRSIVETELGILLNGEFFVCGRGGYFENVKIATHDAVLHVEEAHLALVEAQRRYEEALRAAYEHG